MIFLTESQRATEMLGEALGRTAFPGAIAALWGQLGAGKTALTRGSGRGLEVRGRVTSPTFTLVNQIPGRLTLYHMDLYRLSDAEEAENTGITEMWYQGGVSFIEWPEVVRELLPEERLDILFHFTDNGRAICLKPFGERYEQWAREAENAYCGN
ncbi:MAG: tRNA (adenosine(37)-N6)-threonylcarbamoyltransferase complex ATPase subunit type 1 TsaE [Christensenellales bacterium]|jgi:tRNA threonylcarbamoyladenosine biosynthesis protein TsaE